MQTMTTSKTTLSADQLADFRRLAQQRLQGRGNITQFNYALAKLLRKSDKHDKSFNTDVMNIKIGAATVDKDGHILRNTQGQNQYTPKAQQDMNEDILDLSNTCEYEMEPHFVKREYIPTDLSIEELLVYTGLLITQELAQELLENAGKTDEAIVLQRTIDMGAESLSPEMCNNLESILQHLANTRNLKVPVMTAPEVTK